MLEFTINTAKKAGKLLLEHFEKLDKSEVSFKGKRNLVTVADKESEQFIANEIRHAFPEHSILAEENVREKKPSEYEWIVDPLDGTINYAHGHPHFCVSMALAREGEIVLGVIHAPVLGETYYATIGEGAFLGTRRIKVSETSKLINSLLATGFAYVREETMNNNIENFSRLSMKARGVRRYGSAAIDLAYVAAGRLEGFWELYLAPWDVAAGSLIIKEAGGKVTDVSLKNDYIYGQNIVASNGQIHDAIIDNLNPFTEDDKTDSQG